MILALCDRFGCTPGQLGRESTAVVRLLATVRAAEGGDAGG